MKGSIDFKKHRSVLIDNARNAGYNAVAAFQPENIYYTTGFWGEAVAICTNDRLRLIVPKLEVQRAEDTSSGCDIIPSDRGEDLVKKILENIKDKKKICVDQSDYFTLNYIQKELGRKNIDVSNEVFLQTRAIKDKQEILRISKCAQIIDTLYEICRDEIRVGMSEQELQAKLVYEAMIRGANPSSYGATLNPLIIASGPNSSRPHAEVSNRKFLRGDVIVVDLTLRYHCYIADATRTFILGKASNSIKKLYDLVRDSQEAGIMAVHRGATCGHVDLACRARMDSHGRNYSRYFIHSTGHGIGLDVHEKPWVRSKSQEILRKGMAITIEPGVYLHGKFGIRIEDSLVVANDDPIGIGDKKIKVTNLNHFTKEMLEIG